MSDQTISEIKNFREQLFLAFKYRADATMELIDSIAGNINATSITELSLNSNFRHRYSSISDAINNFAINDKQQIEQILIKCCKPITPSRPYHLLALDCTSAPRQYAKTLADRSIVHAPNPTPGNKPTTVGHQYSVLGYLPEKSLKPNAPCWFLPLSTNRVASDEKGINVGSQQLKNIMPALSQELSVIVADSAYSAHTFIASITPYDNTILIARLRGNRIFNYQAAEKPKYAKRLRGHVTKYGKEFKCKDSSTWGTPDEITTEAVQTKKGKNYTAEISCWNDMLIRQKNNIALHKNPFTLVKIRLFDEDNKQVFKTMWLMVIGKRRKELTLNQTFCCYKQRYDIEHFFKFGKSRLLMDKFQTTDVKHEESWWQMVSLAQAQLYMSRELATNHPRAWEKYLPQMQNSRSEKSPRQVQKSFVEITKEIGTPASCPKPRGIVLGRKPRAAQSRRIRHPIIFKSQKPQILEAS